MGRGAGVRTKRAHERGSVGKWSNCCPLPQHRITSIPTDVPVNPPPPPGVPALACSPRDRLSLPPNQSLTLCCPPASPVLKGLSPGLKTYGRFSIAAEVATWTIVYRKHGPGILWACNSESPESRGLGLALSLKRAP